LSLQLLQSVPAAVDGERYAAQRSLSQPPATPKRLTLPPTSSLLMSQTKSSQRNSLSLPLLSLSLSLLSRYWSISKRRLSPTVRSVREFAAPSRRFPLATRSVSFRNSIAVWLLNCSARAKNSGKKPETLFQTAESSIAFAVSLRSCASSSFKRLLISSIFSSSTINVERFFLQRRAENQSKT
jgi:hypothetical protein